jgi:hypothetical protein
MSTAACDDLIVAFVAGDFQSVRFSKFLGARHGVHPQTAQTLTFVFAFTRRRISSAQRWQKYTSGPLQRTWQ